MKMINQNALSPALSKQAVAMDTLDTKDVIRGIKTAASLERETIRRQREQVAERKNRKVEEQAIPTGNEIRQAYEEGTYR